MSTKLLTTAALLAFAGAAQAQIPLFNASCPDGVLVHGERGGPIFVNGDEAVTVKVSDTFYEAKHHHVTILLALNANGTPEVSVKRQHGDNGVCEVTGNG